MARIWARFALEPGHALFCLSIRIYFPLLGMGRAYVYVDIGHADQTPLIGAFPVLF